MYRSILTSAICLVAIYLIVGTFANSAFAAKLEIESDAHWLIHIATNTILYTHIGTGFVGILTGIIASIVLKGSPMHRVAGKTFFWSMLICYAIGGAVAPFLESQQSTNFVAAVLALYLLLSGFSAAKRRNFTSGMQEKLGLVAAISITALGTLFLFLSSNSPDGSFDGSPPQAYILFIAAGSIAFIGEAKVIVQKSLSRRQRTVRHLWRMSMSFFIASGSAFFGQVQYFPEGFDGSVLQLLLGFFPFLILFIYLIKYGWLSIFDRAKGKFKTT